MYRIPSIHSEIKQMSSNKKKDEEKHPGADNSSNMIEDEKEKDASKKKKQKRKQTDTKTAAKPKAKKKKPTAIEERQNELLKKAHDKIVEALATIEMADGWKPNLSDPKETNSRVSTRIALKSALMLIQESSPRTKFKVCFGITHAPIEVKINKL